MPGSDQNLQTTYNCCAVCNRPEFDGDDMMICNQCQKYYHCSCVGETMYQKDVNWSCQECLDPEVDKALEEEIRKLEKDLEREKQALRLEKVLFKKRLEHKRKIFLMRRQAEKEKYDMELDFEKERLETEYEFCTEHNEEDAATETEVSTSDRNFIALPVATKRRPTKAQLSARQFLSTKLPLFSGNIEEWPMFISAIETSSEACGFSDVENLARLQQCLKGQALDVVRSRLLLPSAVPQIIETLKMLYGRPELLLNMLLANVRKAPAPQADKLASFIRFGVVVQQLTDHLEATKMLAHMVNPMLLQELTEKLPATTQLEWVRYRRKAHDITLRTFANFLSEILRDASELVSYCDSAEEIDIEEDYDRVEIPGQEGYLHSHSDERKSRAEFEQTKMKPCRICGFYNHRIRNCEAFKQLSLTKRWEAVREWKLCYQCLNEHGNSLCRLNIRCNVGQCTKSHNPLLHFQNFSSK